MSLVQPRSFLVLVIAACGAGDPASPDAPPPSTIPTRPAGTFTLASELDLAIPAVAAPVLATLTAATDGPDDPARFLIDGIVAALPDGTVKTFAASAAPYVAAYVNARLAEAAPRLRPGLAALATGLAGVASHLGTLEALRVDPGGNATRTITALRFAVGGAVTVVPLGDVGLAAPTAPTQVTLDATGHLEIAAHGLALPYRAALRLGLARAVIPAVTPGATDLAQALGALVDCAALGVRIADAIGVGSAALYDTACRAAMTALASELDARLAALDATPFTLRATGQAQALDRDGDGAIDELRGGIWTGALDAAGTPGALRAGSFAGTAP